MYTSFGLSLKHVAAERFSANIIVHHKTFLAVLPSHYIFYMFIKNY